MTDNNDVKKLDSAELEAVETPEPIEHVAGDAGDGDETVVTFGDDEAPDGEAQAPEWVKDVRKRNRDLAKQNANLQKQIDAGKADDDTALGAEPTLEDCDYEADVYRDKLRAWDTAKAKRDAKAQRVKDQQEGHTKAYNVKLDEYREGQKDFEVGVFDEAEGAVKDALSETQQSIIIQGFGRKAASLISGLGRDDKRLKELAAISDPIAFTVAVTRLESVMKTSQRKPKTAPETMVAGNSSTESGGKQLEKLRADAAKTGDMSKVVAFKRQLKA